MLVIGLKTASSKDIKALKKKYPLGFHKTRKSDGTPLPYNGLFIAHHISARSSAG